MPELPEVQTTTNGINQFVRNLRITDVWSDYDSKFHAGKQNIKNRNFFLEFRKKISGKKILRANRRGKNILIEIDGGWTILVHMKMTGHFLYGKYKKLTGQKTKQKSASEWVAVEPGPLRDDPFNRFVRLVFSLSNGKHLVLSDLRKFAKILLIEKGEPIGDLENLGPEPLDKKFTTEEFTKCLMKKTGKIKKVLMDQSVIAGIGNIYSDEILWQTSVHPLSFTTNLPHKKIDRMYKVLKKILRRSIEIRGDSESDYRDILGRPGNFQKETSVYGQKGKKCRKKGCLGVIERIKISGRSAHFCPKHQIRY